MQREGRGGALVGVWCALGLMITVAWAQTAVAQCNRINWLRSIYCSLEKVEGGVHRHEEASQRRTSVQADQPCNGEEICRASARCDARQSVRHCARKIAPQLPTVLGVTFVAMIVAMAGDAIAEFCWASGDGPHRAGRDPVRGGWREALDPHLKVEDKWSTVVPRRSI